LPPPALTGVTIPASNRFAYDVRVGRINRGARVNIGEIAKRSGVARSTVSFALSGRPIRRPVHHR